MRKILKIAIVVIAVLILAAGIYVATPHHATETATAYLKGTDDVNVSRVSNGLFLDGYGNDSALIFYPGAKVEYTAYLPMLTEIAGNGTDCYVVEMPLNFAFFGIDSADSIISNSSYKHYFLSGHSLGGVMAGEYINHSSKVDGLILIGAYVDKVIDVPTLSIYGSNDTVLNMENYNKSKELFTNNFTEYVVVGGNHAQWGYYGNQAADSPANITAEEQQNQGVNQIIKFINHYS